MKRKGISLIVLVITVIVIIILATAIIVNIANTNVIDNSHAAVFKSDVAAMQDELTMYIADEYTGALGKYDSRKLQATEEGIWYGSTQQEGNITDIITSMDKKYVGKLFIQDGILVANKMNVTVEEEKWLNELGIASTTQKDIGKIDITPSTTDWTNGNVEVEINYTKEIPEGYAIEYKINNGEWQEGTRVVVEENNTKVTARLYSKEKDNEALTNSYTVSKIDKEVPDITNMKIDIIASTNSITATASGATDSLSGEIKYKYSINNSTWQTSGTFSSLNGGTPYTIYAKAVDKAGNESGSISNKITTLVTANDVKNNANKYYGNYIQYNTGVSEIDNNVKWKVFHSDGNNIYLIAADYIPISILPKTSNGNKPENNTDVHTTYAARLNNVLSDYNNGTATITDSRIKALNNSYFNDKKYTSTNNNMKGAAYLLDISIWNKFTNSYSDYSIGGPTLELLFNSYNNYYGTKIEAIASSNLGYNMRTNNGELKDSISYLLDTTNPLYVINSDTNAKGMWLASTAHTTDGLNGWVSASYSTGTVGYYYYNGTDLGFRPIVCLKSTVKLDVSTGTYIIK